MKNTSTSRPVAAIKWGAFEHLVRPDQRLPQPIDIATARLALKEFLKETPVWTQAFQQFHLDNLGTDFDGDWTAFNEFLCSRVSLNRDGDDIDDIWVGVIWAIGLLLGNQLIAQGGTNKLRWKVEDVSIKAFGESGRFHFSIMGFPTTNLSICPDFRILNNLRDLLLEEHEPSDNIFRDVMANAKYWNSFS